MKTWSRRSKAGWVKERSEPRALKWRQESPVQEEHSPKNLYHGLLRRGKTIPQGRRRQLRSFAQGHVSDSMSHYCKQNRRGNLPKACLMAPQSMFITFGALCVSSSPSQDHSWLSSPESPTSTPSYAEEHQDHSWLSSPESPTSAPSYAEEQRKDRTGTSQVLQLLESQPPWPLTYGQCELNRD
jgi:hypothetical protein